MFYFQIGTRQVINNLDYILCCVKRKKTFFFWGGGKEHGWVRKNEISYSKWEFQQEKQFTISNLFYKLKLFFLLQNFFLGTMSNLFYKLKPFSCCKISSRGQWAIYFTNWNLFPVAKCLLEHCCFKWILLLGFVKSFV